jgi:hypothetical protein
MAYCSSILNTWRQPQVQEFCRLPKALSPLTFSFLPPALLLLLFNPQYRPRAHNLFERAQLRRSEKNKDLIINGEEASECEDIIAL